MERALCVSVFSLVLDAGIYGIGHDAISRASRSQVPDVNGPRSTRELLGWSSAALDKPYTRRPSPPSGCPLKVVEPYVLSASLVRDSTKRDQRCGRGPIRIHKVQVSREGADPL